jgi:hypothetical protein
LAIVLSFQRPEQGYGFRGEGGAGSSRGAVVAVGPEDERAHARLIHALAKCGALVGTIGMNLSPHHLATSRHSVYSRSSIALSSRPRQHGAHLGLDRIERRRIERGAHFPPSLVAHVRAHGLGALARVDVADRGDDPLRARPPRREHGGPAELPVPIDGRNVLLGARLPVHDPEGRPLGAHLRVVGLIRPHDVDGAGEDLSLVHVPARAALDAPHVPVGPVAERHLRERSRGNGQAQVFREEGEASGVGLVEPVEDTDSPGAYFAPADGVVQEHVDRPTQRRRPPTLAGEPGERRGAGAGGDVAEDRERGGHGAPSSS